MIATTVKPPNGRGCGHRDERAVYLCHGPSISGLPLEHFLIDPAIPWKSPDGSVVFKRSRAPVLFEGKNGVFHAGVFLSKKDYPAAWDYVEETRSYGVSRKFPPSFPFEKLTPGRSQILFFHEYCIPDFNFVLDRDAPLQHCHVAASGAEWEETIPGYHPYAKGEHSVCTLGLRDLAFLSHPEAVPDYALVSDADEPIAIKNYRVVGPSYAYELKQPGNFQELLDGPASNYLWEMGAFMSLPITHVEFCRKANEELATKAMKAGFEVHVLEW